MEIDPEKPERAKGQITGRRILISATVLAAMAAVIFWIQNNDEPSYEGKRLTQWIAGLEYENLNPRPDQQVALRAMANQQYRP